MELILAILSSLAIGNATVTASPPAFFNQDSVEATTCHTITGLKQPVIGTLNTLDYLQNNSGDYGTLMQKLHLDFKKEGALSWFKGSSFDTGFAMFLEDAQRTAENTKSTVWLYQNEDSKPSARPTARLSSWYTNDGKASDTFPFLKTQLMHIQKCELTYSK